MRTKGLVAAVAVLVLAVAGVSSAVDFGILNGSYMADVASQYGMSGIVTSVISTTFSGTAATSHGSSSQILDGMVGFQSNHPEVWYVNGLGASGNSQGQLGAVTVVADMGQVWNINRIEMAGPIFGFPVNQYQLRVSTDNTTWITEVSPGAGQKNYQNTATFSAIDARYIEWTSYGPSDWGGADIGELRAFVASGAAKKPQMQDGYNIARGNGSTVGSKIISNSFQNGGGQTPSGMFDGRAYNNVGLDPGTASGAGHVGTGTAVIDLGALYKIGYITADMVGSWSDAQIAVGSGSSGPWTLIKGVGGLSEGAGGLALGGHAFAFTPQMARYVEVIGTGDSGNMLANMSVYTVIPEPGTLALLGLGGLGMLRRRRGARG